MRVSRAVRPAFLLLTGELLLVTGCGKKPETAPTKKIAGIDFQEDQFFQLVIFGMRDAAASSGVELLEANNAGKPDKEIQLINTYIDLAVALTAGLGPDYLSSITVLRSIDDSV